MRESEVNFTAGKVMVLKVIFRNNPVSFLGGGVEGRVGGFLESTG